MTLVVEDGTGVVDADSYVSVETVDSYAVNFGYTSWAALTTDRKEINIRKATQFLDNKYPMPGTPLKLDQGLHFPAKGVYVFDSCISGVPKQVKNAVCELAIAGITTDLTESVQGRTYTYRKVKAGDVEKTERYDSDNPEKTFQTAEMLLSPLLSVSIGRGVSQQRIMRG